MSPMPSGPGERPKRSWRAFFDRDGLLSAATVLIAVPRLTGADHDAEKLSLVEAQMSWAPSPPARFEEKTTSSPSLRTFGWISFAAASLRPTTGVEPPKYQPSPSLGLMEISPGTTAELDEKKRNTSSSFSTYEGPCSSSAVFGPTGAQPRFRGCAPV